jgi:hypothetical protein
MMCEEEIDLNYCNQILFDLGGQLTLFFCEREGIADFDLF